MTRLERDFGRTRRRWNLAWLGGLVILIGYSCFAVPQVARSGWVGVVPTTVEILVLPLLGRPNAHEQDSWANAPSSVGLRASLYLDLRRNRIDAGRPWLWQWRLLCEIVLSGDPEKPGARDRWDDRYGGYISLMFRRLDLPERQQCRLLDWTATDLVRTRSRWPSDAAVPVRLIASQFFESATNGRTLRVRSVSPPGAAAEIPAPGPSWWKDATEYAAWKGAMISIGPVPEGASVELELEIVEITREDWDAGRREGRSFWKRRLTLPVRVEGTVHDLMQPVSSDGDCLGLRLTIAEATRNLRAGKGFRFTLGPEDTMSSIKEKTERRARYQQGDPSVSGDEVMWQWRPRLYLPQGTVESPRSMNLADRIIALNNVICGLRLEVLRDGAVVADGSIWGVGSPGTGRSNFGSGDLIQRFEPVIVTWRATPPSLEEAKFSAWTLRMIGDPVVALQYDASDRYWAGQVEVPMTPSGDPPPPAPRFPTPGQ